MLFDGLSASEIAKHVAVFLHNLSGNLHLPPRVFFSDKLLFPRHDFFAPLGRHIQHTRVIAKRTFVGATTALMFEDGTVESFVYCDLLQAASAINLGLAGLQESPILPRPIDLIFIVFRHIVERT